MQIYYIIIYYVSMKPQETEKESINSKHQYYNITRSYNML